MEPNNAIVPDVPIVPKVPDVPKFSKVPIVPLDVPCFSFFISLITNITPHSVTTLQKVYAAITSNSYRNCTQRLREITDPTQARKYKAANFDYCTFSGVFTSRSNKALIRHSSLLCIDFDHLQNISEMKDILLADDYFDTELLFVSPSGDGLKWIISIDIAATSHGDYFAAVSNYIKATYHIETDKSGRDVSRACFLPHDPQAYINPVHLK
jgi:hypothetical protein